MAPNFLQASDLDSYQSPHAYLHAEASSEGGSGDGDASPPDGQSLCDEQTIIDLSMPESSSGEGENTQQQSLFDPKDELIGCLRRDLDSERETRERLIQEARSRIEQYEQRLIQMKQEIDLHQQTADERLEELQSLKTSAQSVQEKAQSADELEKKAQEKEQKFLKMKGIYDNLREEHIKALTEIRDLRSKADTHDKEFQAKVEEIRQISQNLEEAKQERSLVQEQVQTSANSLSSVQSKIENLEAENTKLLEELEKAGKEHSEMVEKLRTENESKQESDRRDAIAGLCAAAATILDQSQEDLQNATSISYPPHLAAISLRNVIEYLDSTLLPSLKSEPMEVPKLCESAIVFVNRLSSMVVNCASSAYTSSIQHFEPVNEECRRVISNTAAFYANLKNFDGEAHSNLLNVKPTLEKLEELVKALPSLSAGDIDVEAVGSQLDDEMNVWMRQSKTRLEVNEKILESCTSLMSAVRILVSRSRDVQEEIVSSGKGTASPDEFYKRNHLWSEGLLSAARAVGVAATELVNSADGVVGGTAKYEHLIVAAQEIGASVAQLFVSSRVKADKDSQKMKELGAASKSVNGYTASVVAAVKSGQQSLADEKLLDFTHFSLHEAKKEEMESQVRCLELEASLQGERNRLAALRKQHYHMASLVQNNQSNDKNGTNTMQN